MGIERNREVQGSYIRSPDAAFKPEKPFARARSEENEKAESLAKDVAKMLRRIDSLCKRKDLNGQESVRLILSRNSLKQALDNLEGVAGQKAPALPPVNETNQLGAVASELVKEVRDMLPQVEELRKDAAGRREGMKFMLVGTALESALSALEKLEKP